MGKSGFVVQENLLVTYQNRTILVEIFTLVGVRRARMWMIVTLLAYLMRWNSHL